MSEVHGEGVSTFLPYGPLGAWDLTQPFEHVDTPVFLIFHGLGHEPKRVIAPPILPFLFEPANHQLVDLLFLHGGNIQPSIDNIGGVRARI